MVIEISKTNSRPGFSDLDYPHGLRFRAPVGRHAWLSIANTPRLHPSCDGRTEHACTHTHAALLYRVGQ